MSDKIKFAIVDFFGGDADQWFAQMMMDALEPLGGAELSTDPDFVLCSCFGKNVLKYDCTRILFLGENIRPDFNLYDYAMGGDWMEYEDRFLHLPWYCFPGQEKVREEALLKHTHPDEYYKAKKGFCNYVVSNYGANPVREQMFEELSKYKWVASGGRSHNNLPDGKPVADKLAFQKDYRFSLCFENARTSGYCTEKILDAFASGGVPVYWGDPAVARTYNPEAFIDCSSCKSVQEMVEKVRAVEEDPDRWWYMVHQPAFVDEQLVRSQISGDLMWDFVRKIVAQGPEASRRRSPDFWTGKYEQQARQVARLQRSRLWKLYEKGERFGVRKGWLK